MAKFNVTAPEPNYVGSISGVEFTDGRAVIDEEIHPAVLAYCRGAGYHVEPVEAPKVQRQTPKSDGPFDPSEHDMPSVLAYLKDADSDEALRVLDAEAEGKNRKGITDQRDAILASKKGEDQ